MVRGFDTEETAPNISVTSMNPSAVQNKVLPKFGEYTKNRPNSYFQSNSKEANEEVEKTINYLPPKIQRDGGIGSQRKGSMFNNVGKPLLINTAYCDDESEYQPQYEERKVTGYMSSEKPIVLNSYSSIYKQ